VPLTRDSSHCTPGVGGGGAGGGGGGGGGDRSQSVHRLIEDLFARSHVAYDQQKHAEKMTQSVAEAQQASLTQQITSLITAEISDNDEIHKNDVNTTRRIDTNTNAGKLNEKSGAGRKRNCKLSIQTIFDEGVQTSAQDGGQCTVPPVKRKRKKNSASAAVTEVSETFQSKSRGVQFFDATNEMSRRLMHHDEESQILEEIYQKNFAKLRSAAIVSNHYPSEPLIIDCMKNDTQLAARQTVCHDGYQFVPNSLETITESAYGSPNILTTKNDATEDVHNVDGWKEVATEEVKEEVNNNHSNEIRNDTAAAASAAVRTGEQMCSGVRKSKRCNRAKKYNELVSQGVLHTSRKRLDSRYDTGCRIGSKLRKNSC